MRQPFTITEFRAAYDTDPWTGVITDRQTGLPLAGTKVTVLGKRVLAHDLIWFDFYGEWPVHKITPSGDNHIGNLHVTLHGNNRSGRRGVGWHAASGSYRARINIDGKRLELGYFKDPDEAEAAYLAQKGLLK